MPQIHETCNRVTSRVWIGYFIRDIDRDKMSTPLFFNSSHLSNELSCVDNSLSRL